ncbi:Conserved phage protein [Burkholderia diffusa]|uniref:hypothetical protein n=1 Tax=Burkholderia diffusa TaxID=488732 RepID=UPI001CB233B2|nr:hypothetical protein [Burkholderia diffusa]CAG9265721.1 Conserved phage protein [Burkholderia diffusa]
MARARNIKPGTMENEELAALPSLHRLLWIYLWMLADREGRLEDRPSRIKALALPYDEANADAILRDLHNAGFIVRYVVDKRRYIQIPNFTKHQTPHRNEKPSAIPPAPDIPEPIQAEPRLVVDTDAREPTRESSTTKVSSTCDLGSKDLHPNTQALRPDCLIEDSPIDDSPIADSPKVDPDTLSPALPVEPREKRDSRGTRLPATWTLPDEWAVWAESKCGLLPPAIARIGEDFGDYWHSKAGTSAIKRDWFATWRIWCRKERDKARSTRGPPHVGRQDNAALCSLDSGALDAMARQLGITAARPGESMRAFIGRIEVAQRRRDLH